MSNPTMFSSRKSINGSSEHERDHLDSPKNQPKPKPTSPRPELAQLADCLGLNGKPSNRPK